MKSVNCFYIFSSVFAVVCGTHIPDEKPIDEEALAELGFPHLSHPYVFGWSSVGEPTLESDFDLSPPPPLTPLEVMRESRTRFRQRPSNTNGDRGSARRNENANRRTNNNNNSNRNSNNNRNNNRSNSNRNPTDTNELSNSDEDLMALLFRDDNNGKRDVFLRKQQRLEDIRNFYNVGEIRKKREADPIAGANPTAGRFRGKRGYCRKCGGGGLGGGALPGYQAPVYGGHRPPYGGGCNNCGGGYPGFGGGGGGGHPGFGGGYPGFSGGGGGGQSGSFSQSSSQASSSSGSYNCGK